MGGMILAGGKSSRMGQDKALLPYRNGTLLEYVLATLRSVTEPLVIVADTADKYALVGVPTLADLYPDAGPVGGIVTGLRALGVGTHLAVACDMPHLNPDLLRFLLEAATDEYDAFVPQIGGRMEPLCAVYRHTALLPLQKFLESGERAAHRAMKTLRTRTIDEEVLRRLDPELACFTNWNTPADVKGESFE